MLARGHGDPGLRSSSAWPILLPWDPLLCMGPWIWGPCPSGAWLHLQGARTGLATPQGLCLGTPGPNTSRAGVTFVCRNALAAGALAGGLWAHGRQWWAAGSVAAWEAPSPWVLAGPPTGPQVLSKPSPSPRQAAKLLPQPQSPLETFYCQMFCFFHRTRGQHEVAGGRLTPPDLQPGPVSQPVLQTLCLPSQPTQGK